MSYVICPCLAELQHNLTVATELSWPHAHSPHAVPPAHSAQHTASSTLRCLHERHECTCVCLTCTVGGPHTHSAALVGRACWRINVALQMGEAKGTCAIQQAIVIQGRQFAPCFVRMGRAPTTRAVTSCSSACMSVHACGNTCASPATLSAPSSHRMQLPIPYLSDIAAAMQHAPISPLACTPSGKHASNSSHDKQFISSSMLTAWWHVSSRMTLL